MVGGRRAKADLDLECAQPRDDRGQNPLAMLLMAIVAPIAAMIVQLVAPTAVDPVTRSPNR